MKKILIAIIALLFIGIGVILFLSFKDSGESAYTETPANTTTSNATETAAETTTKTFTMAEVANHSSASDCYTVIEGSVYDLSNFVGKHPGGEEAIMSICGKDGTAAFSAQHGDDRRPNNTLSSLKIGALAE